MVEHHIAPHPDFQEGPLAYYDPTAFGILKQAFRAAGRDGNRITLLPTTVQTESGLVLAHPIAADGRDTLFRHHTGLVGLGTEWSSCDIGETVIGSRLHTDNGRHQDVDTNPVMLLDALEKSGDELTPPNQVSVEIQETALDGLWVYTLSRMPAGIRIFNPYDYLPTQMV